MVEKMRVGRVFRGRKWCLGSGLGPPGSGGEWAGEERSRPEKSGTENGYHFSA